ncbi:TRAP transporter substrate-binding protein DctP [Chromohalobacter sp. TMW 2.2308]|uniref:TRAP transporter substrate-binding protein DctP n=1 Tax=Chromohalobacter moromii TaxID=2860329 RepID=A0A9X3AYA2_9GAMM|nr:MULTISPECIES: TRAP transporter substrate-binding protein DctP [Chromohalobacter]MCK2041236.1 TRAP transporter substrate-binding protein DctP [Chromohalobacter moromii]MCK2046865.1 TRAP transporter substrate-binding protein DctP [Chromohalobacter moromii]MCT8506442.1 TRAP transporter substrate-binding protein DctP [Chromohalobacter moromii]MCT8513384.1 TRAP transporter substrate-binding protein DctP [Chromohalobacter sp. TMW 2.2271]
MHFSMLRPVLLTTAITGLLTTASLANAATTINLSYNGPSDADKNAVHLFASNLKRLVEEKTDGDIQLKLYPNSMLGEEQERMEQVANTPSLNIASFAGLSPIVPEIYVSATPFLFDDYNAAHEFFDEGDYWNKVEQALKERTGAELLGVIEEGGFLGFTNSKRPIKGPDDFEGLRFRAMDPSQVALYEAFGASGTPIPWTDTYMALKTNVADGQMNPPMYIIMGSLYEVQKYFTRANVQYSDQFLVANGSWYEGLSEDDRHAIDSAVEEANELNREDVEKRVDERVQFLADNGMTVIEPSDEEMAAFREKGQPAYIEWLEEQGIGDEWIKMALEDAGQSDLLSD